MANTTSAPVVPAIDFSAILEQLKQEAHVASLAIEQKERLVGALRAYRSAQENVARKAHAALHTELPLLGVLAGISAEPPADPFKAALWRSARKARAAIIKEADDAIRFIAKEAEVSYRNLVALNGAYLAEANALRAYASLEDALAALGKSEARKPRRSRVPATKEAPKPKQERKRFTKRSVDEAKKRLAALGIRAVEGNGVITITAGMMRVARLAGEDAHAKLVKAANAAVKAAENGGDEAARAAVLEALS